MMNRPASTSRAKRAAAEPKSKPLLWINKGRESDSLTKVSKDERSLINSHVQYATKHRGRGRKRVIPDGSESTSKPINKATPSENTIPQDTEQVRRPHIKASTVSSSRGDVAKDHINVSALARETPLVRPIQYLDKAVDPFACSSITIDYQTHNLLQLWLAHFQIWFVDLKSTKAKQDLIMSHSHAIIMNCIHDELSMQCLLAYICSLKENIMHKNSPGPAQTPIFVQRAISALRQRIATSGEVDNALIRAIYNLACTEWFRFNSEEGAMPHFRTVKYLVDQQGGLAKLDHQLRMAVIMADVYLAVERLVPPIFPLTWDPGPLPKPVWDKIAAMKDPKLGEGFGRDHKLFQGAPNLDKIIDNILDLTTAEVFDATFKEKDPQIGEYISLRQMALLHRLMSLQIDPKLKERWSLAVVQTALVLWILLAMTKWIRSTLGPLIAPRFQRVLQRCKADDKTDFFEVYPEIALWVLATGAMTPAKPDTKKWFVDELAEACRRLKLKTGADLIRVLKSYLYLDKMRDLGLDRVISSLDDLH